ncbi:hypothetical protein GC173_08110 [bacterium]|nr:hypothetical protein [bacterium]
MFMRFMKPFMQFFIPDGIIGTGDVVIPEVISAEAVQNALFEELPLLRGPHVLDLSSTKDVIYKDGGDTITFLTQEFADGVTSAGEYAKPLVRDSKTGADGTKIVIDKYTEAVSGKQVPIVYEEYMMEDVATQADVNGFLGRLIGQSQGETIQRALVAKANADGCLRVSRLSETTKTLSVDAILRAKTAWGDKAFNFVPGSRPGLYLHSKQITDLLESAEYKSLGTAATTSIVQVEAEAGAVAVIHGVVLYPMDTVPNQAAIPAITGITQTGGTATVTTDGAHGLVVGDVVSISGASQAGYNLDAVVLSVPTASTFTYAVAGGTASPATGSPVFTPNYNGLLLAPKALGLLVKSVKTKPLIRFAGSSVVQLDTDFRWVDTRFRRKPVPVVKLVTR